MAFDRSLFFPPKNRRLANAISIRTPGEFRKSIKKLKENGLSMRERRALVLAKNRSKAQLMRSNLSKRERRQFTEIVETPIPRVTKRKKRRIEFFGF